jgi:hypothetical protein
MLEVFVAHPQFVILALLGAVGLTLLSAGAAVVFETQRARLPAATKLEDVYGRLQLAREELKRAEEQIKAKQLEVTERDRVLAEIASIKAQLEAVQLEYSGLDDARRQIEATKKDAMEAAEKYAAEQDKFSSALKDLADAKQAAEEIKAKVAAAEGELKRLEGEQTLLRTVLEQKAKDIEQEIERLLKTRAELQDELDRMRGERAVTLAANLEAASLAARKDGLSRDIELLKAERGKHEEAAEASLSAKDDAMSELEIVREEFRAANRGRDSALDEMHEANARKAAIQEAIKGIEKRDVISFPEEMLNDLRQRPAPLVDVRSSERAPQREVDALNEVMAYLDKLKLNYSRRTVFAFHTALKINDYSQMTVLAGVSGTGKSLLPRRYAQAMGIHFLPIAVEPRWDSPQDLLGFYNYIEKRYRATDLARALVQMDPYDHSGMSEKIFGDHMMLVLLDEMNLARVEYYFSEFLSRLEARPVWNQAKDDKARQDALISIDIRGRSEGPVKLFPSHNMLFVGTMNDDESTQSLSDKVLDRANIMQFAKPDVFQHELTPTDVPPQSNYRSFKHWRSWVRLADALGGDDRDRIRGHIGELSDIMEDCGRPFGHRLNAAIFAYCANYPGESKQGDGYRTALVDQIEFRILPKLRGVQIDDHGEQFDKLGKLAGETLGDSKFAERLRSLVEKQRATGGLFNWRGHTRDRDGGA